VRLLVFGGWGQLGSELAAAAGKSHDLIRPRHSEVDVSDREAVERAVLDHRPDVVIDAAAFHKVELCEQDPEQAFRVNAFGGFNVARAAGGVGARVVFVSTDYVFDGGNRIGYAEDAPVAPVNVYGASKVAGEWMVRLAAANWLVIRGSGIFGRAGSSGKGGNFIETMLAKAAGGEPISVVDDQIFAPTSASDMARRILLLLERGAPPGVYHAANAGSCSWYELARKTFELAGVQADLSPRPSGEQPVRRPSFSVLLDTRSQELGLPPMRPWQEALRTYLEDRQARVGA